MWNYLLYLLLIVFGLLYTLELTSGFLFSGRVNDLLANLFAALIAVLIIDRIVRRSELQKKERTMNYVRRSVGAGLTDLIWGMRPPEDWKKRLKERVSIEGTWNDFFNNVWNVKEDTLRSLQGLLEAYHDLMDEQMAADIFEIISLLKNPYWLLIDPNDKRERDIHDVSSISEYTTIIIKQAKDMIKRHKFFDYSVRIITSSEGEPPKITSQRREKTHIETLRKEQYSIHEEILKESIEFRDVCTDTWIKKANPKNI